MEAAQVVPTHAIKFMFGGLEIKALTSITFTTTTNLNETTTQGSGAYQEFNPGLNGGTASIAFIGQTGVTPAGEANLVEFLKQVDKQQKANADQSPVIITSAPVDDTNRTFVIETSTYFIESVETSNEVGSNVAGSVALTRTGAPSYVYPAES